MSGADLVTPGFPYQSYSVPLRQQAVPLVEIVYYTDPLCCWSWAMEPQWRKLQYQFEGLLKIRYCMGGLLPSWKHFVDGMNSVSRPAQMGPIWMEAAHVSGMPIHNRIWIDRPPASSYLSCIAVKCAGLQSPHMEMQYLRLLREAIMIDNKDISIQTQLLEIATSLAEKEEGFDLTQFKNDLTNSRGREAFRDDLAEVKARNINRFPTLIFSRMGRPSLASTGYRKYDALLHLLDEMMPGIKPVKEIVNQDAYSNYWGSITKRELDEVAPPAM